MTFVDAVASSFRNYARFRGVASRKAFWYWRLFAFLLSIVASTADSVLAAKTGNSSMLFTPVSFVASLAIALPDLAVTVRRFHDGGHSGHWLWLNLVPIACFVPLINSLVEFEKTGATPEADPTLSLAAVGFLASFIAVIALQLSFLLQPTKLDGNRFRSSLD